jgi:hypothetical protein
MTWCLVKHRVNFTFTVQLKYSSCNTCSIWDGDNKNYTVGFLQKSGSVQCNDSVSSKDILQSPNRRCLCLQFIPHVSSYRRALCNFLG